MAGGKYLQQKPPRKGGNQNTGRTVNQEKNMVRQAPAAESKSSGSKKVLLIVLIVLLVLIIGGAVAGIIYYNSVLNMMTRPDNVTVETLSEEEINELLGLTATEEVTETTSPLETWPEVKSDKNITNIMLIGQAARAGEDYRLSDSNILVSINRKQKTVTLTSIIRDLCVNIPAYDGHKGGYNRINVVYHLGSYYTGEKIDSMKMMEQCIENNFGVKVDHTIEVDFEIAELIVNAFGGVTVELSKEEIEYMQLNYGTHEPVWYLQEGENLLDGYTALGYARLRKVGNGDWDRTARQREIISILFNACKGANIMTLMNTLKSMMPLIVTDMTNDEITNLALEILPMMKDLNIQSQTIPFENTWHGTDRDPDGMHDYVIECDLQKNGKMLRESIGYEAE